MIVYRERFGAYNILFWRVYGAPWPRAVLLSIPGTLLGILVHVYAYDYVMTLMNHPAAYLIYGTLVTFGVVFRTNLSYARYWEGCTNARTMSARWSDAAVQVLCSDEAAEKFDNIEGGLRFRSEFLHSMSLLHALALQALRGDDDLANITTGSFLEIPKAPPVDAAEIEGWSTVRGLKGIFGLRGSPKHFRDYWACCPLTVIGGVSADEAEVLEGSNDRVFMVLCWVMRMIGDRRLRGGIKAEAPILSRIYQVISDGMMAYENAYKITITPFPFPFAQSISILLHLNIVVAPLTMARWCGATWLVGVMSFIALFSFFVLNEVAREIEEPFRFDPNDLPEMWYQHSFNSHLVTGFLKSLLPHEPKVFFNQIASEREMQRMMSMHRPTLRRDTTIDMPHSSSESKNE